MEKRGKHWFPCSWFSELEADAEGEGAAPAMAADEWSAEEAAVGPAGPDGDGEDDVIDDYPDEYDDGEDEDEEDGEEDDAEDATGAVDGDAEDPAGSDAGSLESSEGVPSGAELQRRASGAGAGDGATAAGRGAERPEEAGSAPPPRRLHRKKKKHKKPKIKKRVMFFADVWAFNLTKRWWQHVELVREEGLPAAPTPRWKPATVVSNEHRRMVLFGGCKTTSMKGVMDDLWVFELLTGGDQARGQWRRINTANPPQARRGHIAVANSSHLVVMGGKGLGWRARTGKGGKGRKPKQHAVVLRDLWALPLSALDAGGAASGEATSAPAAEWVPGAPFPGSLRWGASGTHLRTSSGDEVLAVFGGRNKNPGYKTHEASDEAYTYYNELWLYHFANDTWSLAESRGPEAPRPRDHHGAGEVGGRLYVFGGRVSEVRSEKSVLNDLWSYSISEGRWTQHFALEGDLPESRFMPGVVGLEAGRADHLEAGGVAVFAGEHLPGSTKRTSFNDLWIYSLVSMMWFQLSESHCGKKWTMPKELRRPPTHRREALASDGCTHALAIAMGEVGVISLLIASGMWFLHRLHNKGLQLEAAANTDPAYQRMQ